jgi:quercetin dioxygenase-like cupin family protein
MEKNTLFVVAATIPPEPAGSGIVRRILGNDPQMMMVQVCFTKGSVGALHHHPHRQVTYVAEGRFSVTIGEETRTLSPGDSFFVPPGIEHGVVAEDDGILIDVFTPAREDFLPPRKGPGSPGSPGPDNRY